MKHSNNNQFDDEFKRLNGIFYTITNPFKIDIFYKWLSLIPKEAKEIILEPFAGANHIVEMINEINSDFKWKCYDINPGQYNSCDEFKVEKRDTIQYFPKGFRTVITNPPYLAKNSATRRNLHFPQTKYDDIYKLSLDIMLENCDYIAAIIPESFITQNLFHDRLYAVVSLTCKMFNDTECPVCLALFVPEKSDDFQIYQQNRFIGTYLTLKENIEMSSYNKVSWKFNDKNGEIGLFAVDSKNKESIRFCLGKEIPSSAINNTSRSITRISGINTDVDLELFVDKCNEILKNYRVSTKDVFLTSFKGLRDDNQYRRRLDYKTTRNILNKAMEFFDKEDNS